MKNNFVNNDTEYSKRVRQLEKEGLTTSDAQAVADLENLDDTKI